MSKTLSIGNVKFIPKQFGLILCYQLNVERLLADMILFLLLVGSKQLSFSSVSQLPQRLIGLRWLFLSFSVIHSVLLWPFKLQIAYLWISIVRFIFLQNLEFRILCETQIFFLIKCISSSKVEVHKWNWGSPSSSCKYSMQNYEELCALLLDSIWVLS